MRFSIVMLALVLALPGCGSESEEQAQQPPTPPPSNGTQASGGTNPALASAHGVDAETAKRLGDAMAKGRAFLLSQQLENGGWTVPMPDAKADIGMTAMGVLGVISATDKMSTKSDEAILKALRFIASGQKENGAIYDNPQLANYYTSVAIGAFSAARIPDFAKISSTARNYLADSQIRGDENDPSYGGFPYKQESHGQAADLSNAQMAAQALHDGNLPKDHEAWKAMRKYLGRVQGNSEVNDYVAKVEVDGETRTVVAGNDGGGFYSPEESKAGMAKRSDGKWEFKSYGSMSYALLKCLIFAGVPPTDRRVQLVVKWISDHWTVDKNPGFDGAKDPESASQQGFYYYLYTASRALAEYEKAIGKPLEIRDANGRAHNWRKEIVQKLVELQKDDGSWQSSNPRWHESVKVLATSYALQSLAFVTGRLP